MSFIALLFSLIITVQCLPAPSVSPRCFKHRAQEKKPLKLAVLETGIRPSSWVQKYGSVLDDMKQMLEPAFHITHAKSYAAYNDRDIPSVEEMNKFDVIIIPGSNLSANSTHPWMQRVITQVIKNEKRTAWLMGICFGHQLIARAFGGIITKVPDECGWESGVRTVQVNHDCVPSLAHNITSLTCHTQHVSKMPIYGNFSLWATNENCKNQGMISRERRIITTQFHPDLCKEYFCATAGCRGADEFTIQQVCESRLNCEEMAWILKRLIYNMQK